MRLPLLLYIITSHKQLLIIRDRATLGMMAFWFNLKLSFILGKIAYIFIMD
jgi:hypothetical protein